jgi:hypothetical protein
MEQNAGLVLRFYYHRYREEADFQGKNQPETAGQEV